MADIQSNIRVNLDTSSALESLKNLQRQISAFQRQMQASSAANAASAQDLQRSLIGDINATGKFAARMQSIKSSTESFTSALEKNKLSLGEYFRYTASGSKTFGKNFINEFNTIEKTARERVKTLQTQYISLGRDASGSLNSIAVRPLTLDLNNLATQQAINAQKQQIFNQLLKQGSTNLLNFGKNTQWAGRQLMVGFTIPLSIFGSTAAQAFMELEQATIKFKRVYGDLMTPTSETDSMIEQVKTLGEEFTKYGIAVKDTMTLAASAAAMGKKGADLTAQVTEATRLSVLGNVDQQLALETSISLTNTFGVATSQLAGKIDFLNAVENQTVTSIEDLTEAIPKAGPVVQQLGGNVQDLAFFLTAMKEGGINASEGANALKSGLASLINPSQKAADMLKIYGVNIREIVSNNAGDVKGTVIDFAKALDTLDPLTRARAIEQLFGKFQFSRISTLFQNVVAEGSQASKVLELMGATTSELAALSDKELKTVEESITYKFKAAIEEFKAQLAPVGAEFMKLVTPLIEFGSKVLETFNNMGDHAKGFIIGTIAVLGGLAPVALMTFGLVANGVANLVKGFQFLRNIFLGVSNSEQVLGEQTSYLTQEQLKASAVAASLEQTHSRLPQIFTAEASAVDLLAAAYQRADVASQRFAGRPIGTSIGKSPAVQKFANGGFVSGEGTGTSDSIAAMVSNGEAIIPADKAKKYAPLISGIIAGKIPGFARGTVSVGGSAYETRSTRSDAPIKSFIDRLLSFGNKVEDITAMLDGIAESGKKLTKANVEAAAKQSKMTTSDPNRLQKGHIQDTIAINPDKSRILGSLTRDMLPSQNSKLKTGQATADFEKQWFSVVDGLVGTVKSGGLKITDGVRQTVNEIDAEIGREAIRLAEAADGFVNDTIVAQAATNVRNQNRGAGGNRGDVVAAMDRQAGARVWAPATAETLGGNWTEDVRNKLKTGIASWREGTEEIRMVIDGESKTIARVSSDIVKRLEAAKTEVERLEILTGKGSTFRPADRIPLDQRTYTSQNATGTMGNLDAVVGGAMNARSDAASPAKKTIKAAENLVDGVVVAVQQGRDEVQQAMESTVTQAATGAGRARRGRASSQGQVSVGTGPMTFTRDNKSGNVFSSEKMAQVEAGRAAAIGRASGMVVSSLSGVAQKAMMVSGAVGSIAMGLEMSGVKLGAFGDALFTITNSVFAFSSVLELLTKGQMLQTAIGGGMTAARGVKAAGGFAADAAGAIPTKIMGQGGKLANIFGNLGKVITGVLPVLTGVGSKLLAFIPVIGWAVTAFAVFQVVAGIMEQQRKKIEGLGDAAYLTSEKMKQAGDLLGFTATGADFSGAFAGTTAGSTSTQQTKITELRANEDFKSSDKGFGDQIGAIKNATAQQAELSLNSMAIQLSASGAPKEAVDTLIKAIAAEAGRTDLDLSFTSNIDLTTNGGQAQITKLAQEAANTYGDVFAKEYNSNYTSYGQNDALKQSAEQASGVYSTLFSSLKTGFESGAMSAEQFNYQMDNISGNLDSMDPQALAMIVPTIAKNMGLDEQLKGVTDFKDQLIFIKAAASGVDPSKMTKMRDAIITGQKEGATPKEQQAANDARAQLNDLIDKTVVAKEAETKATQANADIEAAMVSADEKITSLRNQIDAYKTLTDQGFSASEAQALAGDAMWATAIAAANAQDAIAGTDENLQAVLTKMRELKKLQGTADKLGVTGGGGGGTPEKTPLQKAMEQLKDQRKEIAQSNTAYAKLTKAGISAGLAFATAQDKILAAAVASTKVGTKQWKELTAQIKAASAAAKANALLDFARNNNTASGLTESFAKIAPMLSKLGLTVDDMQTILGDKDLAQAFIDDMKDGVINSKRVADAINSIPNQKRVEILLNMSTPEGMETEFNKIYDQAMAKIDAEERRVEASYREKEKSAQSAVDTAQASVDSIQKNIDGIQSKIDDKQKDIELTIDRPIEALNKQVEALERSIELNYNRPIANLQEESSALAHDLDLISKKESDINDKYDEQKKNLEKVAEINKDILDADQSRLSIAQALSSGSASAAAKAMQQAQQEESAKAAERAAAAIDAARANELANIRSESGMTKAQIEQRQFEIGQKIYALELKKKKVDGEIQVIQDKIFKIESDRQKKLDDIRILEDQIYKIQTDQLKPAQDNLDKANSVLKTVQDQKQAELDAKAAQRAKWDDLKLAIDEAKTKAFNLEEQYKSALAKVKEIEAAWKAVGTATVASMSGTNTDKPVSTVTTTKPTTTPTTKPTTTTTTKPTTTGPKPGVPYVTQRYIGSKLETVQVTPAGYVGSTFQKEIVKRLVPGTGVYNGSTFVPAQYKAKGGMIMSNYMASGGMARGTDTVPAMLTPGEFVMKRSAVANFGVDGMKAINSGTYNGESVYNYSINVNVATDANPDKIAREVMTQIKRIDSQRIRGNNFNG
jgi:TP901 family phage tail tape measure protein